MSADVPKPRYYPHVILGEARWDIVLDALRKRGTKNALGVSVTIERQLAEFGARRDGDALETPKAAHP